MPRSGREDDPPVTKLIQRMVVRRAIVEAIEPVLRSQGFGAFIKGRSFRYGEQSIDIVEIQFIRAAGMPGNSPSLHVGRYLRFVPEDAISGPVPKSNGRESPSVELCHLRKTVFKVTKQKETPSPNVWFIGGCAAYLRECVAELKVVTEKEVIPWFRSLDESAFLLDLLLCGKADIEGGLADPVMRGTWNIENYFSRYVVAGFVALNSGRWAIARDLLSVVLHDGGVVGKNGKVFPLPPTTVGRIREAMEYASRHEQI